MIKVTYHDISMREFGRTVEKLGDCSTLPFKTKMKIAKFISQWKKHIKGVREVFVQLTPEEQAEFVKREVEFDMEPFTVSQLGDVKELAGSDLLLLAPFVSDMSLT